MREDRARPAGTSEAVVENKDKVQVPVQVSASGWLWQELPIPDISVSVLRAGVKSEAGELCCGVNSSSWQGAGRWEAASLSHGYSRAEITTSELEASSATSTGQISLGHKDCGCAGHRHHESNAP